MRPRVVGRIVGGLGNQLFCYAAARRLALVSGVPLLLDTRSGFVRDRYGRQYLLDRFAIAAGEANRWECFAHVGGRLRRRAMVAANRLLPFQYRWYVREAAPHHFDARLLALRVRWPVYLEGYWQSERYFADVSDTIRAELTLARAPSPEAARLATEMEAAESVSVHLRSFAEVPVAVQPSVWNSPLPLGYYLRAAEHVASVVGSPVFCCFSDDPDWARARLKLPWRVEFVDTSVRRGPDSTVEDLWLMARCRHHIVSNSTLSWWGAWLGTHEGSTVVAPAVAAAADRDWVAATWCTT